MSSEEDDKPKPVVSDEVEIIEKKLSKKERKAAAKKAKKAEEDAAVKEEDAAAKKAEEDAAAKKAEEEAAAKKVFWSQQTLEQENIKLTAKQRAPQTQNRPRIQGQRRRPKRGLMF